MTGGRTWDVIVVGARVAGAATAMLLAREGMRVLLLDRARLPSDAVSSHQVQVPGGVCLKRWGLLGELVSAGVPAASRVQFDLEGIVIRGAQPSVDGVDGVYSPRRYLLDAILLEAALAAGVEVRDNFTVEALVDSDSVICGVVGRHGRGPQITEWARLVVGADGKHSTVARLVGAGEYRRRLSPSFASYGYWVLDPADGVTNPPGPADGVQPGRMFARSGLAAAAFPTQDQATVVFLALPIDRFAEFRRDVEASFLAAADRCGHLGAQLRAGTRVERIRTTNDLPHVLRRPHGPGWALVGDAGAVMHPITAQGITHSLRDAGRSAEAIILGFVPTASEGPTGDLDRALREAWRRRDRELREVFGGTGDLARLTPLNRVQRAQLRATAAHQGRAAAFISSFSGAQPWGNALTPWGVLMNGGAESALATVRNLLRADRDPSGTSGTESPGRESPGTAHSSRADRG